LACQCGSRTAELSRTRCRIDKRLRIGNSFEVTIVIFPDERIVCEDESSIEKTCGDLAFATTTKLHTRIISS